MVGLLYDLKSNGCWPIHYLTDNTSVNLRKDVRAQIRTASRRTRTTTNQFNCQHYPDSLSSSTFRHSSIFFFFAPLPWTLIYDQKMNITHIKVQPFPHSPLLHYHTFLFSSKSFPLPRKFTPASIKKSPSFPSILYKKHTFLSYGCFGNERSRIRSSVSEVEEEQKQKPVVVKRAYIPLMKLSPNGSVIGRKIEPSVRPMMLTLLNPNIMFLTCSLIPGPFMYF